MQISYEMLSNALVHQLTVSRSLEIKLKPLVFSLESFVKRNLLGLELLAIVIESDFSNPVKENIP